MKSPESSHELFDQWLNQKSSEILARIESEKISYVDMFILSFKAYFNHFHHRNFEFQDHFTKIDKRFDELESLLMWGFGLTITLCGIMFKLLAQHQETSSKPIMTIEDVYSSVAVELKEFSGKDSIQTYSAANYTSETDAGLGGSRKYYNYKSHQDCLKDLPALIKGLRAFLIRRLGTE